MCIFILIFVNVFPGCTSLVVCIRMPVKSEVDVGSPETGVTDGWDPLYGFWELDPGLLQQHQVFFCAQASFELRRIF